MSLHGEEGTERHGTVHGSSSGYKTAVYVSVAALVAMLAAIMFYVLCSKRFKLNWYEKSQLSALTDATKAFFGAHEYHRQDHSGLNKERTFLRRSHSDSGMQVHVISGINFIYF